MGPGTGQGAPSRTTPMDTLRQLAGDVSEFLTNRTDMVRNTPILPPAWQGLRDKVASGEITTQDYLAALRSDPTIQREMFDTALNNPFFGPLVSGIRAFHGSPHDFDKFDLSKIGTGEGAQSYGHGLYFAENEAVARSYADGLSEIRINGAPIDFGDPIHLAAAALHRFGGDVDKAIAPYMSRIVNKRFSSPEQEASVREVVRNIRENKNLPSVERVGSRMYEVDINTTPDRLLDWDKPLSEQPAAIQSAWQQWRASRAAKAADRSVYGDISAGRGRYADPTGQDFWGASAEAQPAARATTQLRKAGIDGIRYLDGGSRAAGDGSRNYVIFDDSLINILRKYGILAPLMGAGAVEAVSGAPEQ